MLSSEGDQQEEDRYHGDVGASDRRILEVSRRDHMRNEEIRRILHVSPTDEVMHGDRLRWSGHVQRRDANNGTRRVVELAVHDHRYQLKDEDVLRTHGTNISRTIGHDGRGC